MGYAISNCGLGMEVDEVVWVVVHEILSEVMFPKARRLRLRKLISGMLLALGCTRRGGGGGGIIQL